MGLRTWTLEHGAGGCKVKAQYPAEKQKKESQGILKKKSAISREIAGRTSWTQYKDSQAYGKGNRASKSPLILWQQLYQSNPGTITWVQKWSCGTIQAFLRFKETHLWLSCTAKPKLIGIEETTYIQWVDQYPGSDFQQVIFCPVKITFSCKRQLVDRGYIIFLLIFVVTWSATARANLSILDPASAIFLAALMTSDVFFRGPLPLWNKTQLCTI